MDTEQRLETLYLSIEKIMLSYLNKISGTAYRALDYSFIAREGLSLREIKKEINIIKLLKESTDTRLLTECIADNKQVLIDALEGFPYIHRKSDSLFLRPLYKESVGKDKFYSFFLLDYLTEMGTNRYNSENEKNANLLKEMLTIMSEDVISFCFGSVPKSISVLKLLSVSKNSETISELVNKRVDFVYKNYAKNLYENRVSRYNDWLCHSIDGDFNVFIEYVIENDVPDIDDVYEKVKRSVSGRTLRYCNEDILVGYYQLMGKKNKKELEKLLSSARQRCDRRECRYIAWIKLGYADKKFMRKMRSESSSDVSLSAIKALFLSKDKYSDFHELISQFNDSKFTEVVGFIVRNGDKKTLLGFVGNPLASKDAIFKKINGENSEE